MSLPHRLQPHRPSVRAACLAAWLASATATLVTFASTLAAPPPSVRSLEIRGRPQTLRLFGNPGNLPLVVSSGDGGWIHLAPRVAGTLSRLGYFVVGFDARAYLSSFTEGKVTLTPGEVQGDYLALIRYAAQGGGGKPLLIGVSEGAGLSVLAAADERVKREIAGVIGLGLPDVNELGWRWRDMLTYVTKDDPDEPSFHSMDFIARLAPIPIAAIHSTGDEYVPLEEIRNLMDRAAEPKKLWVIPASNHRFSGNPGELDRAIVEALAWIRQNQPAGD